MIVVECPNCKSKFKLKEDALTRDNLKMRCNICSHIFTYHRTPSPSLEQEFSSLLSGQEEPAAGTQVEWPAEEQDLDWSQAAGDDPPDDEVQPESVIKEIDSILGAGTEIPSTQDNPRRQSGPGRVRRRARVAGICLLAVLLLAGGLWFVRDSLPFWPREAAQVTPEPAKVLGPFFDIPSDSVTFKIVNNQAEGPVMIVSGVVRKLSQKPVRAILMQARVYDQAHQVITTRNAYAGIIPDAVEFTRQKRSVMQTLLGAEPRTLGILATSQEIPFVVAFFGRAAHEGRSFQVEVKEFHWQ